jgi:hypothetical protein
LNPDKKFVIQLDKPFELIAAYDDSTHVMTSESVTRFSNLAVTTLSTGASDFRFHRNYELLITIHAWLMWVSWELLGLVQVTTGRYLRHHYETRQTLHNISGGLLTVTMFCGMTLMWRWILSGFSNAFVEPITGKVNIAGIGGSVEVFAGIALAILGITAEVIRRWTTRPWKTAL